jgi:large subunit ribosomal protein L10
MAISRAKKIQIVERLAEIGRDASAMVFADFFGLKTKDMNELRKTVKSLGGNVLVVKKTLAQRGLKGVVPDDALARPGGIAAIWFKAEDVPAAFKAVWGFSKANEALKILGGYAADLGGIMDAERVIALAKLPSREALLGQFVGMLMYPLRGFVCALAAIQRSKESA